MYCRNLLLWSKSSNRFIRVAEGSGDNLTDEDIDNGYIDYIYLDIFEYDGNEFLEVDGGVYLLKSNYFEIFSGVDEECSKTKIIDYVVHNGIIPGPTVMDGYLYTVLYSEYASEMK